MEIIFLNKKERNYIEADIIVPYDIEKRFLLYGGCERKNSKKRVKTQVQNRVLDLGDFAVDDMGVTWKEL